MKIPFTVLSYGDFKQSYKLFSCEIDGVHTLPIFFEPESAYKFIPKMEKILRECGDDRGLKPQICVNADQAIKIFETLSVHVPDLKQIIIDPSPPEAPIADIKIIEDIRLIVDVLQDLRDMND